MVTQNGKEFEDDDDVDVVVAEPVEEVEAGHVPNRWSWVDFATISLCLVRNLSHTFGGYFDSLARQANEHRLYRTERVDFADSVLKDVSKL